MNKAAKRAKDVQIGPERVSGLVAVAHAISKPNLIPGSDPHAWINMVLCQQYCWWRSELTCCGCWNSPRARGQTSPYTEETSICQKCDNYKQGSPHRGQCGNKSSDSGKQVTVGNKSSGYLSTKTVGEFTLIPN